MQCMIRWGFLRRRGWLGVIVCPFNMGSGRGRLISKWVKHVCVSECHGTEGDRRCIKVQDTPTSGTIDEVRISSMALFLSLGFVCEERYGFDIKWMHFM